tara:strand:+ start:103 stop:285 length:183 start_codon:yes stop_codon:yes gene_type:complete
MKNLKTIIGLLLIIIALISLIEYAIDYNQLSEYGKGYIWGKIVILIIGFFLVFTSLRNKK